MNDKQTIEKLKSRIRELELRNAECAKAEEALRASRQRYATLIETLPHGILECTVDGIITFSNSAHHKILGYSDGELIGKPVFDLFSNDAEKQLLSGRMKKLAAKQPTPKPYITTNFTKDGRRIDLQVDWGYRYDPNGKVNGFISVVTDISNRLAATRALEESEQRYRVLFEKAGDAIFLLEANGPDSGNIIHCNQTAAMMHGYSMDEMLKLNIRDLDTPGEAERANTRIRRILAGEWIYEEITHRKKDGTVFPMEISAGLIAIGKKKVIMAIDRDITARVGIEKTLHEQVLFLQTLIDTLPHPVFYKNLDGKYLGCNQAFEAFIGLKKDAIIGKTVSDFLPKDLAESYEAADKTLFKRRLPQSYETTMQFADGSQREVLLNKAVFYHQDGSLAGMVGAIIDISDQKRAEKEKALQEKQMRQAQKMEAIGTLAGGIAHDFNNILSAIVGYTDIALLDVPAESAVYGFLKKVHKASDRARSLVYQILTFSRATEQENRPVVLKHIAKETLKLLRATLPSTISIEANLQSDATILSDPTRIHQVMMNLCTNAAHAMQDNGGRLIVTLEETMPDKDIQDPDFEPGTGPYLKLSVADTGTGIDQDIIDRIFDPFFTTKKLGEGTGMGLAVVHGIVKECGGSIQVQSIPDLGTTFEVWLPTIKVESETATPIESSLPVGDERILFVDDEPDIVDVGLQMLELLGYHVTAIDDSHKALDVFRDSPNDVDLVITDMTMPHMTGDVLSRRLLDIRPDLPIIICTGYSEKISEDNIHTLGIAGIAYKPLIMSDLAQLIRKTLDRQKSVRAASG